MFWIRVNNIDTGIDVIFNPYRYDNELLHDFEIFLFNTKIAENHVKHAKIMNIFVHTPRLVCADK